MKKIQSLLLLLSGIAGIADAQLSIDGGFFRITNGAALVINGGTLNRSSAGGIISEGADNRVVWQVGNSTATLKVPFFTLGGQYIPTSFKLASGATNDGNFTFATYAGADWKNSAYLPPTVTNVDRNGSDNSSQLVDRFWRVQPMGYAIYPDITNLELSYAPTEATQAGNSLSTSSLIAQRWNTGLVKWDDYFPTSTAEPGNNLVKVANLPANQVFSWWALVDGSAPLPISLVYFKAVDRASDVLTTWQTASETNTKLFEVQRGKDGSSFNAIGQLAAAGNSTVSHSYSYTDPSPLAGISYYRLKWVDQDGRQHFSTIVSVNRNASEQWYAYPNPVKDACYVQVPQSMVLQHPLLQVFDASGKMVLSQTVVVPTTRVQMSNMASGNYRLRITSGTGVQMLNIIKQ